MNFVRRLALLGSLALVLLACATTAPAPSAPSAPPLPPPVRWVTDLAGVLSPQDVETLERRIAEIESTGRAQVAVYIAPSLPEGEVLEDLTFRLANEWGIGHAGVNDGVVLFVFMKQKKVRIELGEGSARSISDEAAGRVIADDIAPSFRQGRHGEGLLRALDSLAKLLER